jgi:outer membrane receptor protein involved in Fe transport
MEALRGGTNPVLSNGQPGLTTNFLLREGSEDTEGSIKYSTTDYGLQRIDGVISGQIADDLYFMMGGYIKSSPGARDAGFNAEKGNQFTINITKELDNGKINLYTRQTDDHGTWYVPAPITVDGVDAGYTQIGTNNRLQEIEFGDGESEVFDFGKGRGWDGSVSGGSIDLTLDNGWLLVDRFSYTSGDANTFGLVPQGGAVKLSTVADNGVSATGLATGTVYDGDTDVQMIGGWVVLKEIEAFTNDFILTKTFDIGSVTGGFYNSTYSSKDWWSIGNQSYHVVAQGGENLTGIDCNDNADHCNWSYDINSIGEGQTTALYMAGSLEVSDAITLDAGVRRENHEIEYTLDVGLDGTIDQVTSFDETSTSWTVGANWMFADKKGVFVRVSEGSKMPFFDDLREGKIDPQNVDQYELGYKHSSDYFELYATGFFNEVTGDKFSPRPGAPIQVTTTEAYGVELDFSFLTDNGFSVAVGATLQQTEQTESSSPENIGNEAARLPNWQVRITPSYDFEFDNGLYGTLYGTISSAADRFSDNGNTDALILESFTKIDLGVIVNVTDEVRMQLAVNNLTDEEGLTEGDPRGTSGILDNGRYILPRSVDFNVSYSF